MPIEQQGQFDLRRQRLRIRAVEQELRPQIAMRCSVPRFGKLVSAPSVGRHLNQGRFWGKADINREVEPAGSVENDP